MANQLILDRALDANGYVAPGALATIYTAGTSTLLSVYSDTAGTVAAANPIEADGNGFWPQRYVTEAAKAVVTDADAVALYTLDPVPATSGTASAASDVSFAPTVELPYTNAQDAIEAAAQTAVSGFAAFGLGITGNATLLADIDATNIGAGAYRFDGTTTGTYPTGVVAADTGQIETWRQSATVAMMELHHATTDRKFRRRMSAGAWGAWRENVEVNIGATTGDTIYRGASNWTRLAVGTTDQVLKVTGGLPVWGNPAGRVLLDDQELGVATAQIDFTAFNNAVYSYYEFELVNVSPVTDNTSLYARISSDGGSSYLSGAAAYSYVMRNLAIGGSGTVTTNGSTTAFRVSDDIGSAAGELGATGTVKLYPGSLETSKPALVSQVVSDDNGGSHQQADASGRYNTTVVANAIRFFAATGNLDTGSRIRMYGMA